MTQPILVPALLLLGLVWSNPGSGLAQERGPEEDVLTVVQGFFDALREKNEAGLQRALAPGARIMGFRIGEGNPSLQTTEFSDFIPRVVTMDAELNERHSDVQVEVRGILANVWQRYHMFVNGEFSHCGTEAIHLSRFPEGWKILHLSETLTNEGCGVEG